jgi:hypothetical protein
MPTQRKRGELKPGQPHPAVWIAKQYLEGLGLAKLLLLLEAFSSCAIESIGNSEIYAETLDRLLNNKPLSDRYLMGLAWAVWKMEKEG